MSEVGLNPGPSKCKDYNAAALTVTIPTPWFKNFCLVSCYEPVVVILISSLICQNIWRSTMTWHILRLMQNLICFKKINLVSRNLLTGYN